MPSELWDFFWWNRFLLNKIGILAARSVQTIADSKGVTPAIFIAIHTFGRDLKRNVHIHLSVTTGGISFNLCAWKNLFFDQQTLMRIWRYEIITLFRTSVLTLPPQVKAQLNHLGFNAFLDRLYKKTWIVHCAKPSNDYPSIVAYLGRYIKRPAIAESKLRHYDGNKVTFRHLDHTSDTWKNLTLSVEDFIGKFVQHIPDKGFRMIRYYGLLATRVRGKLLPLAHFLLGQEMPEDTSAPAHAELILKNFGFDPLICILCGARMVLTLIRYGKADVLSLLEKHRQLALLKKI